MHNKYIKEVTAAFKKCQIRNLQLLSIGKYRALIICGPEL